MHAKVEAAVADEIRKVKGLDAMGVPLESFSVTKKVEVITEAAVSKKLKVAPPSLLVNEGIPLPESPYVGVAN